MVSALSSDRDGKLLMHTRNREDIIRTVGLALLRDAFVKDIRSLRPYALKTTFMLEVKEP